MFRDKDRFRPDPDDFVIVIMGPTGSGKSNVSVFVVPLTSNYQVKNDQFINKLTGNTERHKASNLKSDTQDVTPYPISYQGLRVVLVDTPGFDDTYRQDSDILRVIADWLIKKYPDGTPLKIAGIIYVHRITDNRMSGSAYRNLQMFGRLCGSVPLPRTRLITTMWDQSKDQAAGMRRETQLKDDFWRALIQGGARAHKFHNTAESAQEIVGSLLRMGNIEDGEELLLQEELIEQQKRLNETEAGKMIYNRLQKLLADQRKMLKDLAEEAKQQNNPDLVKSLRSECDKVDAQLQRTFEDIKEMKIPLSRRILLWLFGRKSRAKVVELDFAQA
ncbi:P-loop containing nucleoside triphosphate hydrolase protein [Boletus edulis BED1]|uniref:P-loop containing nucleoside triphosphate hydrolase protein n=1 Tax=Boletus edulis BED1 TaxID=1328754 RepID=A0AAD4G6Y1_BOLED|nr:P-loop containing nucleoside triphosphate hydrolase protein [Boletus edulis BED1]